MLYFGHGSNIDRQQMAIRCPGSRFVAPARVHNYRLCFPRWSNVRASAIASMEPAKGEIVWGALYEVTPSDLERLDMIEGFAVSRNPAKNESQRISVRVERPDGISGDARTHIAVPVEDPGKPSPGYILVLVRAATELDFPKDFIARIKAAGSGSLAA
jgi:hypothetical protein